MKHQPNRSPSWDELMASINDAVLHPEDTLWDVYWYVKSNIGTERSEHIRMLLAIYIRVRTLQPSLLNSLFLALAVKASGTYSDFNFAHFLKAWKYPALLRDEDRQPGKGADGRMYQSLHTRVDNALQTYFLHHTTQRTENTSNISQMLASRLYTKDVKGGRHTFVKMVDVEGHSLIVDSRQLPCRFNEIVGKVFDVAVRRSAEGKARAADVVCSEKSAADIFPVVTGIVKGTDYERKQYHVYDAESRHFVAERPAAKLSDGDYVSFIPVIPDNDRFKIAIVQKVLPRQQGRMLFGQHTATVLFVDAARNFLRYRLDHLPPAVADGAYTLEGYARLSDGGIDTQAMMTSVATGSRLSLTLFLKRGKDGLKHNCVADMLPVSEPI